jgi:metal-responsive CopG/Arc/MetJ family transcriptional regulator
MKTAISLPDELFHAVEKLVRRSKRHRSEVYADALREYVARHSPDEITDAYNAVMEEVGPDSDSEQFATAAARHTLANVEW